MAGQQQLQRDEERRQDEIRIKRIQAEIERQRAGMQLDRQRREKELERQRQLRQIELERQRQRQREEEERLREEQKRERERQRQEALERQRVAQEEAARRRALQMQRMQMEAEAREAELRAIEMQKKRVRLENSPGKDHMKALNPDYRTQFKNLVDVWQRLTPYHVLGSIEPDALEEEEWAKQAGQLQRIYAERFLRMQTGLADVLERWDGGAVSGDTRVLKTEEELLVARLLHEDERERLQSARAQLDDLVRGIRPDGNATERQPGSAEHV
eukprot:Plantae.Rhodophyta-Rhodochaete_pulchella.ctg13104.p1 GENE.Plantae.Rhodophyta-Rhodochaete_pulchella.ctg13104~~Plantae.Rhodophyta-Rhodochaete_pulchella.ctg13104.p1  ORF type:complete len:288 (+),score=56.79 Plantae.Rhodophyta-Rhodochaete_pulchella.ctg13104:50-865(+)